MILFHSTAWSFVTSAGGAGGIGPVMASGGLLRLKDPSGTEVNFHFGGVGAGASLGKLKLPKLPPIKIPQMPGSAAGSTTDFWSNGIIFRKSLFGGSELTAADFRGACFYIEGGLSLVAGIGGDLMFFGGSAAIAAGVGAATLGMGAPGALIASSNGVIAWAGVSAGIQAAAGVGGLIGKVW